MKAIIIILLVLLVIAATTADLTWLSVDTPWEDILPYPLDDFAYWFVDTFIKSRYQ